MVFEIDPILIFGTVNSILMILVGVGMYKFKWIFVRARSNTASEKLLKKSAIALMFAGSLMLSGMVLLWLNAFLYAISS